MPLRCHHPLLLAAACVLIAGPAHARTVWRCVVDGTVSLSTAPEPGATCTPREVPDDAVQTPNLWGEMGVFSGVLYEREQDGRLVYGTRRLPGAREYLRFTVQTPPGEPAHAGLGRMGAPRLDAWPALFRDAARSNGLDEAWLRAIAHAESGFEAAAVSPKGARGVMQLMPEVAVEQGVGDLPDQILCGEPQAVGLGHLGAAASGQPSLRSGEGRASRGVEAHAHHGRRPHHACLAAVAWRDVPVDQNGRLD